MEAQSLGGLCLPTIHADVPLTIFMERGEPVLMGMVLSERLACELPTVLPDPKSHATPLDALKETAKNLGMLKLSGSTRLGDVCMVPYDGDLQTESASLGPGYCLLLDDIHVNILPMIQYYESKVKGLGETISYLLKNTITRSWIPGVAHICDAIDRHEEWELEGHTKVSDIRRHLKYNGLEGEEIEARLPRNINAAVGGNIITKPRYRIKSKAKLERAFAEAGRTDHKYLADLLMNKLPECVKDWGNRQHQLSQAFGHENSLYSAYDRYSVVIGGNECEPIEHHIDYTRENYGSNGDCVDPLIIQRVYLANESSQVVDGLEVMIAAGNAVCLLAHTISVLENQDE